MKVFLTEEFVYNGLFVKTVRKYKENEYREVELIGVPFPVDPGIVAIRDGDKIKYVPTCVLEGVPNIDFSKLLTPSQIQERKILGALAGSGFSTLDHEPRIISIEEIISPDKIVETTYKILPESCS